MVGLVRVANEVRFQRCARMRLSVQHQEMKPDSWSIDWFLGAAAAVELSRSSRGRSAVFRPV